MTSFLGFRNRVKRMDRKQVLAKFLATGFQERMVEDFALWLNAARQNKPSSGYYAREGDGFRYLEGETPEIQGGRYEGI
jgi:hypothetical protein